MGNSNTNGGLQREAWIIHITNSTHTVQIREFYLIKECTVLPLIIFDCCLYFLYYLATLHPSLFFNRSSFSSRRRARHVTHIRHRHSAALVVVHIKVHTVCVSLIPLMFHPSHHHIVYLTARIYLMLYTVHCTVYCTTARTTHVTTPMETLAVDMTDKMTTVTANGTVYILSF